MRNLKKLLALVLAMVMAFSLMLTANAAASEPANFKDMAQVTDTYAEAVKVLSALKIVQGDEDGFRPGATIKRSEVATMLYRLTTADTGDKQVGIYTDYNWFDDVKSWAWYAGYVNYCANAQYIKGHAGNFNPEDAVTGYEVLAMALRAVGYDMKDEFTGSGWQIRTASRGRELGILKNINEGTLGAAATREVVAEIMFRAMQVPLVSYTALQDYQPILLAKQTADLGGGGYIYAADVPNTLMYKSFEIVGKRTIVVDDGTYGRPVEEWVTDDDDDTVENGGKYIVNAEGDGVVADKDGTTTTWGAPYIPASTPAANYANADVTKLSIPMTPEFTFYNAMTECDLSKEINNDTKISWTNITEYVNGGLVVNRNDLDDDQTYETGVNEKFFDALHTTNTSVTGQQTSDYTIGAAGRTTEIYKYKEGGTTKWRFVYIDTLLGEVEKVVPRTLDTNDHVVTKAELHIGVNDYVTGDNAIVKTSNTNYNREVGELVLLTTYGLKDEAAASKIGKNLASPIEVNYAILDAVPADGPNGGPSAYTDFTVLSGGVQVWKVDFASNSVKENSKVPTETLTIQGTLGLADDKTGVIAGGKNYPTTWAYHVDHDGTVTDEKHTKSGTDVNDDTVLDDRCVNVTNAIIGQTYTAALDRHGNIVGMWPGADDKIIGVVTDVDYARIGLGKYAVEFEVFTVDSKTETVRLLDATANYSYFPTQEEADKAITTKADDCLETPARATPDTNPKGALLELTSYIKDGNTYWKVTDSCDTVTSITVSGASAADYFGDKDNNGIVEPGLADTLVGTTHNANKMTDETVFIVAEYDFRYNTGDGNLGSNIDVHYNVYKGFRNLPVISGDQNVGDGSNNILFQILDGKVTGGSGKTDGEAKYVLINAVDPNVKYTVSKPSTILVDDSFLVIAPVATYAQYSEYLVAKNGRTDTIKVANINSTVNDDLQNAIRDKGLLVSTSENSQGYITAVDEVKNVVKWADNLGGYTDTLIGKGQGLHYSKGVLAWDDGGSAPTYTYDTFLTVAEGCIVKIVNVDKATLYDASLSAIEQYQADHDVVFELDANGWVCCLYIID